MHACTQREKERERGRRRDGERERRREGERERGRINVGAQHYKVNRRLYKMQKGLIQTSGQK